MAIKTIGILPKEPAKGDLRAIRLAEDVSEWLLERKFKVVLPDLVKSLIRPNIAKKAKFFAKASFFPHVDVGIVLGGDGTLLQVARMPGSEKVPLLGVHLGEFGFIMEVTEAELYETAEEVLKGKYHISHRMMLSAVVLRKGKEIAHHDALNDIVVTKGAVSRIIMLSVKVDGKEVYEVRSDGIIISTPTGSTAYSLAAGGPIIHVGAPTVAVTPICPHTLSLRPMIFSDSSTIEIDVSRVEEEIILTVDGQISFPLMEKDRVVVGKSPKIISLIQSPKRSYYEVLRSKLKVG